MVYVGMCANSIAEKRWAHNSFAEIFKIFPLQKHEPPRKKREPICKMRIQMVIPARSRIVGTFFSAPIAMI